MDRPTNLMVVTRRCGATSRSTAMRRGRSSRRGSSIAFRPSAGASARRLGLACPSWEDDPDFDLDLHLHRLALPPPGDEAALQELVGDLMAQPLDRSRPLWDMYLIDGYGEGTAIVARMHHCIADGIALSRVLLSLTDDVPDAGIARRRRPRSTTAPAARWPRRCAPARTWPARRCTRGSRSSRIRRPSCAVSSPAARDDGRALAKLLLPGPTRDRAARWPGVARRVAWTDRVALDARSRRSAMAPAPPSTTSC